ncbi:Hypothetical predicted protein [Octopus vulgaris]|uniref:Uncharacterized protein n=1 Tax=Octopus vulgaris TaxID=6645 RepID=A0AA36BYI9_OCTVU|nr:Hypothetical predicted protein [Octopus vulgaris]
MFQSAFTRPAAMAVLLLTLTTILIVTSDQELDGYYKSLGPGYSYGYNGTPPTEQFFSTRNLLDCTALAQRSQSQFFTYNKVSHACKNYSPKNIMTVVSTNDTNEISFYRNSKWIKVYAISKGAGSKVYNSFLNIGLPSTWNVDKCNGTFCPNFFRHPILDFWNNLPIDERFDKMFNTGKCYRSLCISRLHGHIHPPEAAELTQHMITIDTIDVVNVHPIQLTTTGDPHKSRFTF